MNRGRTRSHDCEALLLPRENEMGLASNYDEVLISIINSEIWEDITAARETRQKQNSYSNLRDAYFLRNYILVQRNLKC